MAETNLTLLLIGTIASLVVTAGCLTKVCGPTWFQRMGLCTAIMAIALSAFVSDIHPDMAISIFKPFIEKVIVVLVILSAMVGAFGEVIWNLLHNRESSRGEILRHYVRS